MALKRRFFLDLCCRMEQLSGGRTTPCVECRKRKESFLIYSVGCGEKAVCESYTLSEKQLDDRYEEL